MEFRYSKYNIQELKIKQHLLVFLLFNHGASMISIFRYTTVLFLQNMPPAPSPLFLMITLITSLNYSADDKSKHCSVEAVRSWYLVALESATFDESMINFVSWWSKFPDNNPWLKPNRCQKQCWVCLQKSESTRQRGKREISAKIFGHFHGQKGDNAKVYLSNYF